MDGPIFLNDQVILSGNQKGFARSIHMQNPFRVPVLVDEIRYRITSDSDQELAIALAQIRVRHLLGRTPLMSNTIPIGLLSKSFGMTVPTSLDFPSWYTWKLPKPLYVPATEVLSAELEMPPDIAGTFTVQVSYAARILPDGTPPPEKINVPWACFFQLPEFSSTSGIDVVTTKETDIVNPFNETLFVQRFIGRSVFQTGGGFIETPTIPSQLFEFTTVRAADSFGRILVRDPTPWPHLFYFPDRAWTVNTKLQPKGFYLFEVTRDFTTMEEVEPGALLFSMIGHREVVYQP